MNPKNCIYKIIDPGFSRYCLNSCNHCAPTAPSITRWSHVNVTFRTDDWRKPFGDSGAGNIFVSIPPTAKIAD